MDDDIDYMSDDFITKCLDTKSDVRPGLLKTHNQQREHDLMKKKQNAAVEKKKKPEILQAEMLEEALKQPITSSNKGFSMLQKMGFKSGMGLGKDSKGMVEPIAINIKNDRQGLGHKKPVKHRPQQEKKKKLDLISEDEYRAFLSNKNRERDVLTDLRKSQRICRELDENSNKSEPEEVWFWPEDDSKEDEEIESKEKIEDDKPESEYSNLEKLEFLTRYLRKEYCYCIWCKVRYDDEKDMEECPGTTREDH